MNGMAMDKLEIRWTDKACGYFAVRSIRTVVS